MKKEDLDELSRNLDEIISHYEVDRSIVFGGKEPQLGAFVGAIAESLRKWKRSTKCIYFSCPRPSIKQSHTIQKSSSLRLISEEGHVFGPSLKPTGDIEMKRMGISEASTFPGFCEEHEQLFEEYENQRGLSEEHHYVLQMYRTVCRELVRINHTIQQVESFIAFFEKKRNEALKSLLKKKLGKSRFQTVGDEIKTLTMTGDSGVDAAKAIIAKLNTTKTQIETGILSELKAAIEDPQKNKISAYVITLDEVRLPVCLAGMAGFDVEENGVRRDVTIFLNILPFEMETKLIFCSRHSDASAVSSYLARWPDSISIINMIESWMINGSDHWFIRPTDWNSIGKSRQQKIVAGIRSRNSILDVFPHSILDEIRKSLIESARTQLNTQGKKEYFSRIVKEETLKLLD